MTSYVWLRELEDPKWSRHVFICLSLFGDWHAEDTLVIMHSTCKTTGMLVTQECMQPLSALVKTFSCDGLWDNPSDFAQTGTIGKGETLDIRTPRLDPQILLRLLAFTAVFDEVEHEKILDNDPLTTVSNQF